MEAWPDTRETLIARLRDPEDRRSWEEFVQLYGPLIYRVARKRGAQDSDAQDVAQRVLVTVAEETRRREFDDSKDSFRAWLHRVTTNATINLLQREARHWGSGSSGIRVLLEQKPASEEVTRIWMVERRMQLFRYAAAQVKQRFEHASWQSFWKTAIEGKSPQEVSEQLNRSVGSVYVARSRILAAIRELAREIEREESDFVPTGASKSKPCPANSSEEDSNE